jgi:hypothetical protein
MAYLLDVTTNEAVLTPDEAVAVWAEAAEIILGELRYKRYDLSRITQKNIGGKLLVFYMNGEPIRGVGPLSRGSETDSELSHRVYFGEQLAAQIDEAKRAPQLTPTS